MSHPIEITDANFQHEVLESDRPVLVDFGATWCPPCKMLEPTIDELAVQYEGTVKVGKIDIDENQQITGDYGISSIPAVLLFKEGKVIETLRGVNPKERYQQALEQVPV